MALFDIFSKKNNKRNEDKIKPKILLDIHEKDSGILAELVSRGVESELKNLEVGDYVIGEIIIERKSFSDFASSMLNRRLIVQLNNLKKTIKPLLILEGYEKINEKRGNMNNNSYRGMILSIINDWQIPIVFTKNIEETADYLCLLAKRELKTPSEISLHSRIPKTRDEQKRYVLEAFPNIGSVKAKLLIKKFGNLLKVFNAREEELQEILGIRAKEFMEILNKY